MNYELLEVVSFLSRRSLPFQSYKFIESKKMHYRDTSLTVKK
ncbi:hypothetical protein FSS13T_26850 [Flavobacterium saliperosum S13]|uniref:Uncharacterized protein n=1 Tax=Flavobacterium saliperosum S13 TaxID=1341155 RepID=A0ABN0QD98_9FLAO|nr:hypothetical protein FSS13T_26850 [Flavobacterium saliperosum S13]